MNFYRHLPDEQVEGREIFAQALRKNVNLANGIRRLNAVNATALD